MLHHTWHKIFELNISKPHVKSHLARSNEVYKNLNLLRVVNIFVVEVWYSDSPISDNTKSSFRSSSLVSVGLRWQVYTVDDCHCLLSWSWLRHDVWSVCCLLLFQSTDSSVIRPGCSAVTQCQITAQEKTSSQCLGSSSLLLQVQGRLSSSILYPMLCVVCIKIIYMSF